MEINNPTMCNVTIHQRAWLGERLEFISINVYCVFHVYFKKFKDTEALVSFFFFIYNISAL